MQFSGFKLTLNRGNRLSLSKESTLKQLRYPLSSTMLILLAVLALSGDVYSSAIQRSTVEADHNWKMVWFRINSQDFVQSSATLSRDLDAFTISFWVKDTKGNSESGHCGYLYYKGSAGFQLGVYRARTNLYLKIGSHHTYCGSCIIGLS